MKYAGTILKCVIIEASGAACPFVGAVLSQIPHALTERVDTYRLFPQFFAWNAMPFTLLAAIALMPFSRTSLVAIGIVTYGLTVFLHATVDMSDALSSIAFYTIPMIVTLVILALSILLGMATLIWRTRRTDSKACTRP